MSGAQARRISETSQHLAHGFRRHRTADCRWGAKAFFKFTTFTHNKPMNNDESCDRSKNAPASQCQHLLQWCVGPQRAPAGTVTGEGPLTLILQVSKIPKKI